MEAPAAAAVGRATPAAAAVAAAQPRASAAPASARLPRQRDAGRADRASTRPRHQGGRADAQPADGTRRRIAGAKPLVRAVLRIAARPEAPAHRNRRPAANRCSRYVEDSPEAAATLAAARRKVQETRRLVRGTAGGARWLRTSLRRSVRPSLSRSCGQPHAAVRRRRRGLSAPGSRPGAPAWQTGAARNRRREHRSGPGNPRAPRSAAQPRDSQQPGPRHRAARRARRGRQARHRHHSPRSAPSRRPLRADGVGRWPRR